MTLGMKGKRAGDPEVLGFPHRKSPNISVRAFLCFSLDKVRFMPYNGGILFEIAKEE